MIEFKLSRNINDFIATADEIADYVQGRGGEFYTHKNHITFAVPVKESIFLTLKYPILEMEDYVW